MSENTIGVAEIAGQLRTAFEQAGYTPDGVIGALGDEANGALGRGEVVPGRRATTGGTPLETLCRLFLLGTTEPAALCRAALAPVDLAGAVEMGLLAPAGGDWLRAGLDVRPYGKDGWWVVADVGGDLGGAAGPVRPDHVLGVGGASLTLAGATVRIPVDTALDVGTGSGVQALHLADHAGAVTATDRSPRALSAARATATLSGIEVELVEGDLFEPVAGRRFDLVVSNPPFVVSPAGGYTYRDSGLAGDEVCRRLVRTAPRYLTEGGWCQLLANWTHLLGQDWRDRLADWVAGLGCDAWVLQREVQDPAEYAALWLRDSGDAVDAPAGPHYAARYDAWLAGLERDGVEALGFGVVTLRRTDASEPVVRIEDLRQPVAEPLGRWVRAELERAAAARPLADDGRLLTARLRVAPDLQMAQTAEPSPEGWAVTGQTLVQADGLHRQAVVDPATASLVAGCTGVAPLGDLVAVLAAANGVPFDVLAPLVLAAVRDLVANGFLLPEGV